MKHSSTRIAALARRFLQAEEGAVSIFVAGLLVVLLGMTALGTEIGLVLYQRQSQQMAADSAAFGGVIALQDGESDTGITLEAKAIAANIHYVDGSKGVVVTVNHPPILSVAQAGNSNAVEVVIAKPQTLTLAGLVGSTYGSGPVSWNVKASAVATVGGSPPCAAQLLPNQNPGVTISNGAVVKLNTCPLRVCSTANKALTMSGGAQLNLTDDSGNFTSKYPVSVAGQASITNGATINNVGNQCSSPAPCKASQGACAANVDPYRNAYTLLTLPPAGCSLGTGKVYKYNANVQKINPGVWCNGVSFTSSAQIQMARGIYYVNGGNFNVGGAVVMDGTAGVTIVLTGSSGNYATVTIGNGATVNINAMTTGTTAGIAFFGDKNAPWSSQSNKQQAFGGGASMNINGAIYFPSTQVNFNNGITNPSGCTQLIAGTINFQGGAYFKNNCPGNGTSPIGGSSGATKLVE